MRTDRPARGPVFSANPSISSEARLRCYRSACDAGTAYSLNRRHAFHQAIALQQLRLSIELHRGYLRLLSSPSWLRVRSRNISSACGHCHMCKSKFALDISWSPALLPPSQPVFGTLSPLSAFPLLAPLSGAFFCGSFPSRSDWMAPKERFVTAATFACSPI
jgi:hypothetical protein